MENDLLVSIALCTYNGEKYLSRQLDTLLNQTYNNLELVVVDDRSSDGTLTILREYATHFKHIRVVENEQNLGYIKNFEKVISLCKGDYIALADQDDVWELNKIALMVSELGDNLLIYHDSAFVDDDEQPIGKKMSDVLNMYSGSEPYPFLFYNCVSGHSCLFKVGLISFFGSFDGKIPHDWWIAFVAANKGSIKYIDQCLVKYRQHGNASTDILSLRGLVKDKNKPKYEDIKIDLLQKFVQFDGPIKPYLNRLISAYYKRNWAGTFEFAVLIFTHYSALFFIRKQQGLSKLNYVRKILHHNYRQ